MYQCIHRAMSFATQTVFIIWHVGCVQQVKLRTKIKMNLIIIWNRSVRVVSQLSELLNTFPSVKSFAMICMYNGNMAASAFQCRMCSKCALSNLVIWVGGEYTLGSVRLQFHLWVLWISSDALIILWIDFVQSFIVHSSHWKCEQMQIFAESKNTQLPSVKISHKYIWFLLQILSEYKRLFFIKNIW